ncbi:hypothetical protein M440DRAFT_1140472 [Trichoderma longibrachiatum ATCC 18648]|uniref:Uncharacterized protein n=1 Tax=Trichoderma longibrachiatum ATCC 18648 TaxID=983965 RepID=A0A2T4BQZ9_TRILO|nr:hypothetical protein M440DRAFT_1140472 [Trichoderma longibrachiatum ATCC 18648]
MLTRLCSYNVQVSPNKVCRSVSRSVGRASNRGTRFQDGTTGRGRLTSEDYWVALVDDTPPFPVDHVSKSRSSIQSAVAWELPCWDLACQRSERSVQGVAEGGTMVLSFGYLFMRLRYAISYLIATIHGSHQNVANACRSFWSHLPTVIQLLSTGRRTNLPARRGLHATKGSEPRYSSALEGHPQSHPLISHRSSVPRDHGAPSIMHLVRLLSLIVACHQFRVRERLLIFTRPSCATTRDSRIICSQAQNDERLPDHIHGD